MRKKGQISAIAVVANLALMLLKLGTGLVTGSVALISDGIHSATDLLASLAAWISVCIGDRPADQCHPYGHGKVENLAALGQGMLVLVSAGAIAWQAFARLLQPHPLQVLEWGVAVTVVSILVHSTISWRMWQVAIKTESPALAGGALHMLTDISSSLAVLLGLLVARMWGLYSADAVAALLITLMIAGGAVKLLLSSSRDLVDASLPAPMREDVENILVRHMPPLKGFHKLRSRRVGRFRYLEAHLVVDGAISVESAHRLCDHLEEHLRERVPNSQILFHIEPDPDRLA